MLRGKYSARCARSRHARAGCRGVPRRRQGGGGCHTDNDVAGVLSRPCRQKDGIYCTYMSVQMPSGRGVARQRLRAFGTLAGTSGGGGKERQGRAPSTVAGSFGRSERQGKVFSTTTAAIPSRVIAAVQRAVQAWSDMVVHLLPGWFRSPHDAEIFALALPALFTTLLDPIMGMIDTAIVGRLGTAQLASVGLVTAVFNFSNFMFNFLLYTTTPRIAAAVSKNDTKGVSKIASHGLWLALTIGCGMMTFLFLSCPMLFARMGATPDVLQHAVPYLRVRCLASPCIMMLYVLAGTFRGYKDTASPLRAGIYSNIIHVVLDVAFVFWMNMGAVGAALATTVSLWINFGILFTKICKDGYLDLKDMASYPSFSEISPMLKNGLLLSTRSILGMTILVASTKLITALGAVSLGAHEIIRQIWVVSNQAFTSLDIATQSLIAFYLGRSDTRAAAAVFRRTLGLTAWAGVMTMLALFVYRGNLAAIFTSDIDVITSVSSVIPLIAIFMPFDGIASVMDGVLLGSQQAAWMSKTMVVTACFCALGLLYCSSTPTCTILTVWCVIKMLTTGRFIGNAWKIWSKDSPLGEFWWWAAPSPAQSASPAS